jgi:hypothetical protein
MKQLTLTDGKIFRGATELDIAQGMKLFGYYQKNRTFDQFVDWFVADVADVVLGVTLNVPAGPDAERAVALVNEMVRTNIATLS